MIFAAPGTILSAAYALYLYRRIIFGALVKPSLQAIQDLTLREIAILAPLVVFTIAMGVYPEARLRRHVGVGRQPDRSNTRPRSPLTRRRNSPAHRR